MKPIEYREIDNPASLLKKLNEIVELVTYIHKEVNKCATHMYVDEQISRLGLRTKNTSDLISELEVATKVGALEAQVHSIIGLMTPAVMEVLKRGGAGLEPSPSETDRAQAPTKDDTNTNTK